MRFWGLTLDEPEVPTNQWVIDQVTKRWTKRLATGTEEMTAAGPMITENEFTDGWHNPDDYYPDIGDKEAEFDEVVGVRFWSDVVGSGGAVAGESYLSSVGSSTMDLSSDAWGFARPSERRLRSPPWPYATRRTSSLGCLHCSMAALISSGLARRRIFHTTTSQT